MCILDGENEALMNGILSEKGIAFPIFLIGFMGSGKSTLGSWLAARLNVDFVDLDRLVEAYEGMPIPLIFAQRGEEAFRVAERRALLDFCQLGRRVVVSTGGGAPCYRDNLLHMQRAGTTVYLQLAGCAGYRPNALCWRGCSLRLWQGMWGRCSRRVSHTTARRTWWWRLG